MDGLHALNVWNNLAKAKRCWTEKGDILFDSSVLVHYQRF